MADHRVKVSLPDYPAVLMNKGAESPTLLQDAERFTALCRHYELDDGPDVFTRQTWEKWALVGRKLAEDFVPAYRLRKRLGRPPNNDNYATDEEMARYVGQGLSPFVARYCGARIAAAEFVIAIRGIAATNSESFRRLAGGMPAAKKLRAKLPERYRKHTTAKALQNVWDSIPKGIRDDPEFELRFVGLTESDS